MFVYFPIALLNSLDPLPPVEGVVIPVHFSIAVAQVLCEGAPVVAARWPVIDPVSVSLVVDVGTLIFLRAVLPDSYSESQSVSELSLVE